MTDELAVHTSASIAKTIELLHSDIASQLQLRAGYIDLLSNQERSRPSPGAWVFQTKMVPPIYERLWRPLVTRYLSGKGLSEAEEQRVILQMLRLSPGDRVLDVGCGPGNYTRLVADAVGDGLIVGLDSSESMVSAAVKHGGNSNLAYVRGDGDDLPFRDAQFDAVCCVGAIHLLEDPMAALDGMIRVLAPGGRVALAATCRMGSARHADRVGLTVFEQDELTNAFTAHGLTEVEQRVAKRWQLVSARRPSE